MSPLSFEKLVAHWAHDGTPDDMECIEVHVFACESCTSEATRISSVVVGPRKLPPPILDHAKLAELRTRGLAIDENPIRIGERRSPTSGRVSTSWCIG